MSDLAGAMSAFDEATLVALANAGLYRRAARDLDEGKVRLVSSRGDSAMIEAEGEQVEIDARGPKAARCSCKAPGVCRHRVAAVLLLRRQGSDGPRVARDARDPVALLQAMPIAAVERWAGKAAWRAARELARAPAAVTSDGSALVVVIADAEPVRILAGPGLDGIVSKASNARRKPLHAAAVLAAREHFGLESAASPPEEHATPEPPVAPDRAFLAEVAAAVEEAAAFAFNLAPAPLEEWLFTLSVSSRADALPRLGRLLRVLAAQVRLKRRRAFTFDPDLCLESLGTVHALARALGAVDATTDPERRALLCGVHRQVYAPVEALTLVGCGAERWRSESGARGVTGVFHEPETGRWLTYAHARAPAQDPAFDPIQAFDRVALWGAPPRHALSSARFPLAGAGVSADGRLSNPAGATARIVTTDTAAEVDGPGLFGDWAELEARLAGRFGFGLARHVPSDFAVLAPRRFAAPFFDDLAQELVWPVADADGAWLGLTLAHGEGPDQAIARIERLAAAGWSGKIVVRAAPAGRGVELTPIAVSRGGRWSSLTLDAPEPRTAQDGRWGDLWMRLRTRRGRAEGDFARLAGGPTLAALADAWQRLIDAAEAGSVALRPASISTITAGAGRLDRLGLPTVASRLASFARAPSPATLLPAVHAIGMARGQLLPIPRLRHRRS